MVCLFHEKQISECHMSPCAVSVSAILLFVCYNHRPPGPEHSVNEMQILLTLHGKKQTLTVVLVNNWCVMLCPCLMLGAMTVLEQRRSLMTVMWSGIIVIIVLWSEGME